MESLNFKFEVVSDIINYFVTESRHSQNSVHVKCAKHIPCTVSEYILQWQLANIAQNKTLDKGKCQIGL